MLRKIHLSSLSSVTDRVEYMLGYRIRDSCFSNHEENLNKSVHAHEKKRKKYSGPVFLEE